MPVTIEKKNNKTGRVSKKVYETVAERVRKFRNDCPISNGWTLKTEVTFPDDTTVVAIAIVENPDGKVVATGTAEEKRDASYINKTSAVENAETSAIGRCLFAAGFGGGEFCSADELLTALKRQEDIQNAEYNAVNGNGGSNETPAENPNNGKALGPAIEGVTYRKEGNLIIAEGNTFQSKGLLKSAGFRWDGKKKAWVKEAANA